MNGAPLGLTGLGSWLALALVVIAIIWGQVKKQQMKHELTLRLLEKGREVDAELLAKLIAPVGAPAGADVQKSAAEQHRDGGGMAGFIFIVCGLAISFVSMAGRSALSWPLLGLGVFTFLYGNWVLIGTLKEYNREKQAEKDLSRN
jgi:uncharacterized membrane protein